MSTAHAGSKRTRTRDQLLVASQQLLLEQNATALGIRDIARRAGMVHASFYNYFESVEALLNELSQLLAMAHGSRLAVLTAGREDVAEVFALSTIQTLRFFVQERRDYGRILFDAGLPVDRFVGGMRLGMQVDVQRGADEGRFKVMDVALEVSMVAGSLLSVSLDLYRGTLDARCIPTVTARLLRQLGVPEKEARRLSVMEGPYVPAPPLPLRWQDEAPMQT